MTAAVVPIDEAAARRRQERIRLMASTVREGIDKIASLVDEAKASNDHEALGYASWTAYLADTLGSEPLRLDRNKRREVVALLSGEGMSTRAIAPIVGASKSQVAADLVQVSRTGHLPSVPSPDSWVFGAERLAAGEETSSPEPEADDISEAEFMERTAAATEEELEAALAAARADGDLSRRNVAAHMPGTVGRVELPPFDPATGELLDDEPAPRKTTGLDGKSYPKPTPQKPRRKPLVDALRPKLGRIWLDALDVVAFVNDDRFSANRALLSTRFLGETRAALVALTNFVAALEPQAETEEARDRLVADLDHISETCQRLARTLMEDPK